MAKSKKNNNFIIWAIVSIVMAGLMIGSFFMPVIATSIGTGLGGGASTTSTISCLDIIQNTDLYDDTRIAIGVMGLIVMILGCLLALGSIVSLFMKSKGLNMANILFAVLAFLLAVVALILTFTLNESGGLGDIVTGSVSTSWAMIVATVAGLIACVSTMMNRK